MISRNKGFFSLEFLVPTLGFIFAIVSIEIFYQTVVTPRAHELMVQIARAIERFRREKGRPPVALEELVPALMDSVPDDPWGRPFLYEATGRGYRLTCPAVSGVATGAADSEGLLVVDGEFRTVPR